MRRPCFPPAESKGEPQREIQSADVEHPDMHAAIHEPTAGFAGRVATAAKPFILFFPEENSCGNQHEQADHADGSHDQQAFGCHLGQEGAGSDV